jgi:5S rRNA maturation endonuclease (ribonuclease M5)
MIEAERIARALKGRRSGRGWIAHCPCPNHRHGDKNPSLSITDGDGKLLLKCFKGGTFDEVTAALRARGVIELPRQSRIDPVISMTARTARPAPADYSLDETFDMPSAKTLGFPRKPFIPDDCDRHHIYTDEDGNPVRLVAVKRWSDTDKAVRQFGMLPDGAWDANADKGPMVPYRLGDLLTAPATTPVFICEGEKDADTLANFGHLATTNPNGALSWKNALNKYVAGRAVIIVPDADTAGTKRIADLYGKLKGVVASFKVVSLGLEIKEDHGEDITDWIEKHGHTNEEFIELARAAPEYRPEQSRGAAPLKYELLHDMQSPLTPLPWMIKGIFARRDTTMWYGPPGGLKSALLASATVAIADGEDWFGRKSKGKFGVIYFALERADLVRRRLQATIARKGIDEPLAIAVVPGIRSMNTDTDVTQILATIAELSAVFRKMGADGVGVIVFDTWAKLVASGGGDENSAKDIGPIFANLQRIKDETDVHVALIGHTGKDKDRGLRGSSAAPGDFDLGIAIAGDAIKTATIEKANAVPLGKLFSFGSTLHSFGEDEDGDPIDVNVIKPLGGISGDPSAKKTWPAKLSLLRNALNEVTINTGVEYRIPQGPAVRAVRVADVRKQYTAAYPHDGEGDRQKIADQAWRRHFRKAVDEGLAGYRNDGAEDWMWNAV